MELALALLDRGVIDAGDAQMHRPVFAERPILIAVAAEPGTAAVVPLEGEADDDPVLTERPEWAASAPSEPRAT
jgi:hypothetical protein